MQKFGEIFRNIPEGTKVDPSVKPFTPEPLTIRQNISIRFALARQLRTPKGGTIMPASNQWTLSGGGITVHYSVPAAVFPYVDGGGPKTFTGPKSASLQYPIWGRSPA